MKLRAHEIAFLAICLICAAVGIGLSAYFRTPNASQLDITTPETANAEYPVDILNAASLEDFMEVSGIGQVKAADIIAFRDAIGGFKRVAQLKDISGISDNLYGRIIAHFYTEADIAPVNIEPHEPAVTKSTEVSEVSTSTKTSAKKTEQKSEKGSSSPVTTTTAAETADAPPEEKTIREVDINSADADEIADALLIDYELAEKIVELREKIHKFSSVTELYLVDGVDAETYRRVKDYIVIGEE